MTQNHSRIAIFSGNANRKLCEDVCAASVWAADGLAIGKADVAKFSDGETRIQIRENVRGADVYVVQPTCHPVNDSVMELLAMIDALRRASAGSITAVVPYYGYSRQEKKVEPRVPISARMVANLLERVGVHRLVAMDLHAPQIQGFFDVPVDHLFALPALVGDLAARYPGATVVSPDVGGAQRARAYAKAIEAKSGKLSSLAVIDKRRERANESEVMNVIGDVEGADCLVVDDMIDTAGTLVKCVRALKKRGARSVVAVATHGVFSGKAPSFIAESELTEVIVTDTIPLGDAMRATGKVRVISVAGLIAEAIRRIHNGDSVSSLF